MLVLNVYIIFIQFGVSSKYIYIFNWIQSPLMPKLVYFEFVGY